MGHGMRLRFRRGPQTVSVHLSADQTEPAEPESGSAIYQLTVTATLGNARVGPDLDAGRVLPPGRNGWRGGR